MLTEGLHRAGLRHAVLIYTSHGMPPYTELSSAALRCTNVCRAVLHHVAPKHAAPPQQPCTATDCRNAAPTIKSCSETHSDMQRKHTPCYTAPQHNVSNRTAPRAVHRTPHTAATEHCVPCGAMAPQATPTHRRTVLYCGVM